MNADTIRFRLNDQLLSVARQIVVGQFRRFEYAVVVSDGRLIEVPRIGTARQVAVVDGILNVVASLQQIVQDSQGE